MKARPRKNKPVSISSDEASKIYNLPVGHQVLCDVGWQVPQYLHDNNIKYDGWRQLKPTKNAQVLAGLTDYHEEYHVVGQIPFLVHHRGSMRHAYRTDRMSKRFYETIDAHIALERAVEAHWTWTADVSTLVTVVPVVETQPEVVPVVDATLRTYRDEWLKLSFNGNVTRTRAPLADDRHVNADNPSLSPLQVGHLRVEGVIRSEVLVSVTGISREPYAITFRNATEAPLRVCSGAKRKVIVLAGETMWLLIDVDGVQRVI